MGDMLAYVDNFFLFGHKSMGKEWDDKKVATEKFFKELGIPLHGRMIGEEFKALGWMWNMTSPGPPIMQCMEDKHNYLKLEQAIPRALCADWVAAACAENGFDLDSKPDSWPRERPRMLRAASRRARMAEAAPRLFGAICTLCGGAGRVQLPEELLLDANFVMNWDAGWDQPWREPRGSCVPAARRAARHRVAAAM